MLTREHAEKIATKLKAKPHHGNSHDIAVVEFEGIRIAQFGIRRGSRKDQGHDHIPGQIHVSPHDAMKLAQCPMSFDQWVIKMKEKNIIQTEKKLLPPPPPTQI